jgi:hypothetical protein
MVGGMIMLLCILTAVLGLILPVDSRAAEEHLLWWWLIVYILICSLPWVPLIYISDVLLLGEGLVSYLW